MGAVPIDLGYTTPGPSLEPIVQPIDPTGSPGTNTGDILGGLTSNSGVDPCGGDPLCLSESGSPVLIPGSTSDPSIVQIGDSPASGPNCVDANNVLIDCATGAPANASGPGGTTDASSITRQGVSIASGIGGFLQGIGNALTGVFRPPGSYAVNGAPRPTVQRASSGGGLFGSSGSSSTVWLLAIGLIIVVVVLKNREG